MQSISPYYIGMSRCCGRKGTPNRQFCDYIEHGIGRSTRKSQSGHATSDSVADLLGTISEEHAEKSTGSDTEEPSSTQNRDEQQQSRGIGDSQQTIFDSQEVPLTPTVICREPGCNETSFMGGYCSTYSDSAQRSRETFALRNLHRIRAKSTAKKDEGALRSPPGRLSATPTLISRSVCRHS